MTMKKKGCFVFSLAVIFLSASCSFGVLPEWTRTSTPAVCISLGALEAPGSESTGRAIVQGGGFLYLRTIGGPTASTGPYYGPYTVAAGGTVTITDIPAGTFSRIFVVYSGKAIESSTKYSIMDGSYTFNEFMTMSDELMNQFLDSAGNKSGGSNNDDFGNSFGGVASYGIKESVTLPAGITTDLAMTLIPITSSNTTIPLYQTTSHTFKSDTAAKTFFRLDGINVTLPVTAGNLSCTLSAASATAGSLGTVAFYDSLGKQVTATKTGTSLTGGYTWSIDAATVSSKASSSGYVELYLYLEYTGEIKAQFFNSIPPNICVSIDGEANATWQGHKAIFGIYDESAVTNVLAGKSLLKQMPIALGIVNLDATSGDGFLTLQSSSFKAGSTYYISAQIDVTGHYSSLTSFSGIDLATLIPYKGDLVQSGDAALMLKGVYGLKAFTPGSVVTVSASDLSVCSDNVYFASTSGVGTGLLPTSPVTFVNALALATANPPAQIYLTEDISGVTFQNAVSTKVTVQSYGSMARSFTVISYPPTQPIFQVTSGGSLEFNNVLIDCSSITMQSVSLLTVASGCYLALGSGATLKGTSSSNCTQGGGISVAYGGTLDMWGSTIQNCKTTAVTGYGGAIYAAGMTGISTNVNIGAGCLFTGNSGGSGGAIYTSQYSTLYLKSTAFTSNTATSSVNNAVILALGDVYAKDVTFSGNTATSDHHPGSTGTWTVQP